MQNTRQTYCQSQVIWFQVLLFINLSGHLHHSDFIFVFHVQNYTQEHRSGDQKNSQDNQKVVETTLPSRFVNHWKIKEQENMHISLHESWRLKKLTKIKKKKCFIQAWKIFPKLSKLNAALPQVCDCDDIVYLIPGLITEELVWFEYRQNLGYSVAYSTEPEVWVAYKITKS